MALNRKGSLTAGTKVLVRVTGARSEDGVDSIVETWRCNRDEIFTHLPEKDEASSISANLLCKTVTWRGLGLNLAEYDATFSGFVAGGDAISSAVPVYRLGFIEREAPINSHPNWNTTIKTAIGTAGFNASYQDGIFVAVSNLTAQANLEGLEAYFDMGLSWQEIKLEIGPPSLAKINQIYTTAGLPGPSLSGVPSGRNWRLSAIEGEQEGNVWRNSRTWTLSGRNGWITSPAIYDLA